MFYTVLIQVDTSMASPYKSLYIWVKHFFGYLVYGIFFRHESWRGTWYIYLLSFPRFQTLFIEWFWFWFWSILNGVILKTSNKLFLIGLWWWIKYNNLPWIFGLAEIKKMKNSSNQEMLLTEYHPGHSSTENKFKIHMVNSSSVNHSTSWARKYSLVIRDFYIHLF